MIPKKQHTIPRFYLKRFAGSNPDGMVWTYDAKEGKQWSATPENTCTQTHFYSVERDDDTMDTRLEEFLSKFESRAAPVYEKLLQRELPQAGQAREVFARFLALSYTRTTTMRHLAGEIVGKSAQVHNYITASDPETFNSRMRIYEAETDKKLTSERKKRAKQNMLNPEGFRVEVAKESTLTPLNATDKITQILYKMKWSFFEPAHAHLITSDNPLVLCADPKSYHPSLGDGGFLNKTAVVMFPLSPRLLLFMSWEKYGPDLVPIERDIVHDINNVIASHSDRFLFAHIKDKRIVRLADKHKDTRLEVIVGGPGPDKFAPIKVVRRKNAN